MKIGYLTDNVNPANGWGRYSSGIIDGIKAAGHEAVILTRRAGGDGIPVLRSGLGILSSVLQARKILKGCDIVHAIDLNPFGIIAALARWFTKYPLVLTYVGSYSVAPLSSSKMRWLSLKTIRSSQHSTAISRFVRDLVAKSSGLTNIEVITPGIDFESFYQAHTACAQDFILSVGALKYRKGYHIAIPAFAEVHKKMPHLRYIIVGSQGDVGYFAHLKNLVKKYQLESSVDFVVGVSDKELRDLYRTASLFVLSSVNQGTHLEGFGIVFMEAAASGLPVVGTLGNGSEDAVKDNHNGILVPQENIRATSEAIISILGDRDKWLRFSNASYEWAAINDNKQKIEEYLRIYRGLLK